MRYTMDQVCNLAAEGNLISYCSEKELQDALPQFSEDFEGYLHAAEFCALLAKVYLHSFAEGHIARDLAMKYICLAACASSEGFYAPCLREYAEMVLAIPVGKLYYE